MAARKEKKVESASKAPKTTPPSNTTASTISTLLKYATPLLIAIAVQKSGILEHESVQPVVQDFETSVSDPFLAFINDQVASMTPEHVERPGEKLFAQGARPKHPVVIVPGFTSAGLEIWGSHECAKGYFRQRLWTAVGSTRFLADIGCWLAHMKLSMTTGGDPDEYIRIRSAIGFEAADYFIANYWVMGKVVENLADIGYNPSSMSLEAYDWRLGFEVMEHRDGFFTRLQMRVEQLHQLTGEKAVLVGHSMGSLLVHYFFAWVEDKAGEGWCNTHVHAYTNIAGPHLGLPKAATALMSGEFKETAMLDPIVDVIEEIVGRRDRRDLFNTWGSLWNMLPKGVDNLWTVGADICRPDAKQSGEVIKKEDPFCPKGGGTPILVLSDGATEETDAPTEDKAQALLTNFLKLGRISAGDLTKFITSYGAGHGPNTGHTQQSSFYDDKTPSSKTWHDPTITPLPNAPDMKILCLYGVGVETERGYFYKRNPSPTLTPQDPQVILDATVVDESFNITSGVKISDGDQTVPLISLGYLCADAWVRDSSGLNPHKVPVYTREFQDRSEFQYDDPARGGPHSALHVDILGNVDVIDDLLRIATDFESEQVYKDVIASDIKVIAKEINEHPQGGIFRQEA